MQAQLSANLLRLGAIAEELNRIYAEQISVDAEREIQREREETTVLQFRAVQPVGAQILMGLVLPDGWIDASIIVLFFLIGVVMEITLALSSLSEEKRLHYQPTGIKADDYVPLPAEKPARKRQPKKKEPEFPSLPPATQEDLERLFPKDAPESQPVLNTVLEEKLAEWDKEPLMQTLALERKGFDADNITAYIDASYNNNRLKPGL